MKIQLSQKEVSQLIVNYLAANKLVKAKSLSIEYEISKGTAGNELTVFIEEK